MTPTTATPTKLVPIGNSQGIRIPSTFIKMYQLDKGIVMLTPSKDGLFLTPKHTPRQGRGEQIKQSIAKGNHLDIDTDFLSFPNYFDNHEPQW
jgi:antitoxin component of MazEF toxin-antitoxin module